MSKAEKNPKVAQLDLADEESLSPESPETRQAETALNPDAAYQDALGYLQRGFQVKQITDRLANQGLSRVEAKALAERVWRDNAHERRANAYILLGMGVFLMVLSLIFLVPNVLAWGIEGIVSPALALVAASLWFFYKGWLSYHEAA